MSSAPPQVAVTATYPGASPELLEFDIGANGLSMGEPLEGFQGVLRGVPTYLGASNPLLQEEISRQNWGGVAR